MSILFII